LKFYGIKADSTAYGQFAYTWVNEEHWRSELSIDRFREVAVGGKEKLYRLRSLDFDPLRVGQWRDVWEYPLKNLKLRAGDVINKIRERELKSGEIETCIERIPKDLSVEEVCFDKNSGVLNRHKGATITSEYADFQQFQGKSFPHLIRVISKYEKKQIIEFSVDEITARVVHSATLFDPPVGAEVWPICEEVTVPKALNSPLPQYPTEARAQRIEGDALVYILIGVDGQVYKASIVQSLSPTLDAAAIEAVRRWQFKPAMCGSKAVPFEAFWSASFKLY